MKKLIMIIAAVSMMAASANAQFKIGANIGAAVPTGDFGDMAKTGFGVEVDVKYMLNEKMSVGLGFGQYLFGGKDIETEAGPMPVDGNPYGITSIVGKYNYYFGENAFRPYVGADLGLYILKAKIDIEYAGRTIPYIDESETNFGFAPVIGFEYAFSDSWALNVNAKYNYIMAEESASVFGINAGIVYSFGGQ